MRRKPFSEMEGSDDGLREAFLKAHHGQPPDNFVESSEGGAIDRKYLTKLGPGAKQALREGLQRQLKEADPKAFDRAEDFLWD